MASFNTFIQHESSRKSNPTEERNKGHSDYKSENSLFSSLLITGTLERDPVTLLKY